MATEKLSVTVDADVIRELREQEGPGLNLSALVNEALLSRLKRQNLLALIDEMNRIDPISPEDEAAGEALWQTTLSLLTQGPPPRSRKAIKKSALLSKKR